MVPVLQAEHALLLELASTSLSALDCLGLGVRCVYPLIRLPAGHWVST